MCARLLHGMGSRCIKFKQGTVENHDRRALKTAHIAYRMALPLPLLWRKFALASKEGRKNKLMQAFQELNKETHRPQLTAGNPPHLTQIC